VISNSNLPLESNVSDSFFPVRLAYHLESHMRQALAPILFDDHDRAAAEALRTSPVAKAKPSPAAQRKTKKMHGRRPAGSQLPNVAR